MLIYTVQFPNIFVPNRSAFFDFAQREVVELALKNQALFREYGLDAQFFHKDKQRKGFGAKPVLIHNLLKDGVFSIRAYGDEAVETLRCWLPLFLDENPTYRHHIIEHLENCDILISPKPIIYTSKNWIPFRNVVKQGDFFMDKNSHEAETALSSRLVGNLRTFLNNTGVNDSDLNTQISLVEYPEKSFSLPALKTRIKGQRKILHKQAFQVKVETNLTLPLYFSLGQNVGYGNGLFMRQMCRRENS